MQYLDAGLGFAAVAVYALALNRRCGVALAYAPLVVLCAASLLMALFGAAGLLLPAAWVFYAAALALLVAGGVRAARDRAWRRKLLAACNDWGWLLFLGLGLFMLTYLALRRPLFSDWDEFSFWGTAARLMKQENRLYTLADTGWPIFWSQGPTLLMPGYLLQFFGGEFAPWKVYYAVDLLMFACVAAAAGPARRYYRALPLGAVALLTPFAYNIFGPQVNPQRPYLSALGDIPSGMLLGGACLLYYHLRRAGRPLWPVGVVLAALALCKENVFPLALLAAAIFALDRFIFPPEGALPAGEKAPRGVLRRFVPAAGLLAAPVAAWLGWVAFTQLVLAHKTAQGLVVVQTLTEEARSGLLSRGLGMAAGLIPRSGQFTTAGENIWAYISGANVSVLGTTLAAAAVLAVLCMGCALLCSRPWRGRMVLLSALWAAGFAAYLFMMLLSYAFVMHEDEVAGLHSFARYLDTFMIAWVLVACTVLHQLAYEPGRALVSRLAAAAAGMGLFACLALWMPPETTTLAYPDTYYAQHRLYRDNAAGVLQAVPAGSRLFFVCQGGVGGTWFIYAHHLLPLRLDYSLTGGASLTEEAPDEVAEYMASCDYILVEQTDEAFTEQYGPLFSDGLSSRGPLQPALYRVTGDGAAPFVAVPLPPRQAEGTP